MGKVRVTTFDESGQEEVKKKKPSEKKAQKKTSEKVNEAIPVVVEEPQKEPEEKQASLAQSRSAKSAKKEKFQKKQASPRSATYKDKKTLVDATKKYSLLEALELLPKIGMAKFDETVELHINTDSSVTTSVTLPHGSGKQTRIVVADDAVITDIEKGKINFDVLVALPTMMPKLAKVAKILGPRGLMPNPKNGTVTQNPEEVMKKYSSGYVSVKTEKAPIIHMTVGKVSFGDKKLAENIEVVLKALKNHPLKSVTLKSTMSPAIKLLVA